jgi:DNA-binding transcriptional regulator YiaG
MPNIATVLREEILRLSRKEGRTQIAQTRKATTQHRRDISQLKRQVAQLERQIKMLSRKGTSSPLAASTAEAPKQVRFVAKGLSSLRKRLGLSAGDFGKLIDVSAQSIYNWERGVAYPRAQQLAKLAALRGIGKRDVEARLKPVPRLKRKTARAA